MSDVFLFMILFLVKKLLTSMILFLVKKLLTMGAFKRVIFCCVLLLSLRPDE